MLNSNRRIYLGISCLLLYSPAIDIIAIKLVCEYFQTALLHNEKTYDKNRQDLSQQMIRFCLHTRSFLFSLADTAPYRLCPVLPNTKTACSPYPLRGSYPVPGQDPAFESLISARCLQAAPFVSVKRFVKHTRFPGFEPGFPNRLSFPLFSNDPNLFQGFYAWFSSRVHRRNVV